MVFRYLKFILILLTLFGVQNLCAQKEHNIWYFGDKAGIDFNASPPTPLLDGKNNSIEISAIQSDENGNLLFYADADSIGTTC